MQIKELGSLLRVTLRIINVRRLVHLAGSRTFSHISRGNVTLTKHMLGTTLYPQITEVNSQN